MLTALPFASQAVINAGTAGNIVTTVADLDGDADLDTLSASSDDDKIAWYENNGAAEPIFTEHVVSTAADGASGVAVADIDGDSDLDIVSASALDDKISWYENNGADVPTFAEHVISTTADGAASVAIADVNRDGHLDIASASALDDKISCYLSDGAAVPTFAEHVISTTADGAACVAIADMDRDGHLDIVAASALDDKIAWYENDGASAPAFSEHLVSTTADGATSVAVGDMNGDGQLDLASVSALDDKLAWYENNGAAAPSFSEHVVSTTADAAQSVSLADMDGDGDLDALSASKDDDAVAWYENDGAALPAFTERTISMAADGASSVSVGDVDGDGDLDVLSGSQNDHKVAWYENQTIHRSALFPFQSVIPSDGHMHESVATGDMDGDGDTDVLSASYDDKITWYENVAGDGSLFIGHIISTAVDLGAWVAVGDIDGDGDLDALSASSFDDKIAWYENIAGDGTVFVQHVISTTARSAQFVATADVDRDGDLDVLSASFSDDKIAWYENSGTGASFTLHVVTTAADEAIMVATADMDGDGDVDLLSASQRDDAVSWYENSDGSGDVFLRHIVSTAGNGPGEAEPGDVDGDGDMDIVTSSFVDDTVAWLENVSGNASGFVRHVVSTSADEALAMSMADLDADGDLDLLSASQRDDKIAWYENATGNGSLFITHVISTAADYASAVATGDLDGDGRLDVLSSSMLDDKIAWYPNLGGQFALSTTATAPATIPEGQADDVLKIVASHRGRAGDHAVELTSFSLLFGDSAGVPLNSEEANATIDRLQIYRDTGSGTFEPGNDTLVAVLDSLSLVSGVEAVGFDDGDGNVQIGFGTTKTYFVVVQLTSSASTEGLGFRVTHLTQSTSTADDASAHVPLVLEFAANVASSTTGPVPAVDLMITQSESNDPVIAGSANGNLTYQVKVKNNGHSTATGVTLSEDLTLPGGLSIVSVTPSQGSFTSTTAPDGTWSVGTLAVGSTATLTVVLTAGASTADGATVSSVASVSHVNESRINVTDDSASEITAVARQVDLWVRQVESVDPVIAGSGIGNLTYQITVTNRGPSNATGVTLSENLTLPSGVSVVSVIPSEGSFDDSAAPNGTWNLGTLAVGGSATLTVLLTVAASTPNEATISSVAALIGVSEVRINTGDDSAAESTSVLAQDFGDAPSSYFTRLNSGARHVAKGPRLGNLRDTEANGLPDVAANGDDADGIDDEDGVALPAVLVTRLGTTATVTASTAAKLDAWLDFDRNGTFDAGEQIATNLPMNAGDNSVAFTVPASAMAGMTYARFRLSTAGGLGPKGAAPDGEVEDYALQIVAPPAGSASLLVDPLNSGKNVLLVMGTSQDDALKIDLKKGQLQVTLKKQPLGNFNAAQVGRIVAFGLEGDDTITVGKKVVAPVELQGDDGNDTLTAGGGASVLVGGADNDTLKAGAAAAVLIGGLGADTLKGGKQSDLLIGGPTSYDARDEALQAILAEWASDRSYQERTTRLQLGDGVPKLDETTVFNDGAADSLDGGKGLDWFFAGLEDSLKKLEPGERLDRT